MPKEGRMSKRELIHDVQVTIENVSDLLHTELIHLMTIYGSRVKDELFALALGPGAFKCFEELARTQCRFSANFTDASRFHGVRVVCGPLPFVVPLFTERGWHYAHEEAKRLTSAIGGIDA
jgi:hypothetical protein